MIKASQSEWNEVFNDPHHEPHRDIFSIYRIKDNMHIGEGQLSIDEALGDAQISILIGNKEEWHKGYGTAASLAMLEHIFIHLGLYRAWVDIPEYNSPAKNMFEHLGFTHEGTLRKMYGLSIDKNSVHGSDSIENAKVEINFFFK